MARKPKAAPVEDAETVAAETAPEPEIDPETGEILPGDADDPADEPEIVDISEDGLDLEPDQGELPIGDDPAETDPEDAQDEAHEPEDEPEAPEEPETEEAAPEPAQEPERHPDEPRADEE